jgi:hypothetical protein
MSMSYLSHLAMNGTVRVVSICRVSVRFWLRVDGALARAF